MFATGPANNACLDLCGTTAYGQITTFHGMENIRTLEVMLDVMITNVHSNAGGSITNLLLFGELGRWLFDVDFTAQPTATPLTGLDFKVSRGSTKTVTPGTTAPSYGKRMTLWGQDDQDAVAMYSNGVTGTGVTYTAAEKAVEITAPSSAIVLGLSVLNTTQMRVYEAAIRVNGILVFHIRPKLWMSDSASPGTVPDLSGFGNDLAVFGTHGTDFRYAPAWSKQMPFSGKENVG